jgi:hypothetical protein
MKVTVISTSPSKEKEVIGQLGADAFLVSKNAEQMNTTRFVVIILEGKTLVPWTQTRKRRHFRELPTERLPQYFHRQNKYYFRRISRR